MDVRMWAYRPWTKAERTICWFLTGKKPPIGAEVFLSFVGYDPSADLKKERNKMVEDVIIWRLYNGKIY